MQLHLRYPPHTLRRLFIALVAIELLFVGLHLLLFAVARDTGWHFMFNLDKEGNFPAYFSALQLALIGVILIAIGPGTVSHEGVAPHLFLAAGIGFLLLSADEMLGLHERLVVNLRPYEWIPSFEDGHGVWMLAYLLVALVGAAVWWRPALTLWRRRPRACRVLILGCGLLGFGAVALEIPTYLHPMREENGWLYTGQVAAEEFFEMLGATVILLGAVLIGLDRASDQPVERRRRQRSRRQPAVEPAAAAMALRRPSAPGA